MKGKIQKRNMLVRGDEPAWDGVCTEGGGVETSGAEVGQALGTG